MFSTKPDFDDLIKITDRMLSIAQNLIKVNDKLNTLIDHLDLEYQEKGFISKKKNK